MFHQVVLVVEIGCVANNCPVQRVELKHTLHQFNNGTEVVATQFKESRLKCCEDGKKMLHSENFTGIVDSVFDQLRKWNLSTSDQTFGWLRRATPYTVRVRAFFFLAEAGGIMFRCSQETQLHFAVVYWSYLGCFLLSLK